MVKQEIVKFKYWFFLFFYKFGLCG